MLGSGIGQGRNLDQLGAAQAQHVLLFLALRFRDDDGGAVSPRVGDQRQADARIAGGAFDDQAAGLQVAALFGLQDHVTGRTVLDGLSRVEKFSLAQDFTARRLGQFVEANKRRIPDGVHQAVLDVHVFEFRP